MKDSSFARGAAVLSAGTLVAQSVGVLSTPVLSRLFTPDDFGLLALFSSVMAIGAVVITLRYEMRIVPAKTDGEAKSIFLLVTFLALTFGTGFTLLSLLLPDSARAWMGIGALGHWLSVAFLTSIVAAMVATIGFWFNRFGDYKKLSLLRIVQAVLIALCSLTAGFLSIRNGLLVAFAIASFAALIPFVYLGVSSWRTIPDTTTMAQAARSNRRAPAYLLPTAVMDVFSLQLPFILISAWFSTELTGHYRMAWMILALPGTLVGSAVAKVFFQQYAGLWPDTRRAKKLLVNTWKALAAIGLAPLIVVMLFGESLFAFVLGEVWHEAGKMAIFLAPMVFAMFISSPTSTAYIVMGMERANMFFGALTMLTRPISFYLGYVFNDIYTAILFFVGLEILIIACFQAYLYMKLASHEKEYIPPER